MMEQKRRYSEARLNVVRLSGKSVLLAGSENGGSPAPMQMTGSRSDYITGGVTVTSFQ